MSRRAPVLVWVALASSIPEPALSQGPRAAVDTATTRVVFNEVFGGRGEPSFVVLEGRVAYRMEVEPAGAIVIVRHRVLPGLPPLVLTPLENPAQSGGGASYLLVPGESAEYRLEVYALEWPVRVRIIPDPREMAVLAGRASTSMGQLTIGVRGARFLGSVAVVRAEDGFRNRPETTLTGNMQGFEVCLGILAGSFRPAPRLGGCFATVGWYTHSAGADFLTVGVAPRYAVHTTSGIEASVGLSLGLGTAQKPFRRDARYVLAALGLNLALPGALARLEVEPGIGVVHRGAYYQRPGLDNTQPTRVPGETMLMPRLLIAFHVRT